MPEFMRAAVMDAHGAPLRIGTAPRPTAGPGQVLLRIAAAGLNPLDLKVMEGAAAHARHPAPNIVGMDAAGVVEAVGQGVDRFHEGDQVYGMIGGVGGHQGALAAFAAVDADLLAPKPANLGLREAAALPLAFITAWEGLVDRAGIARGQHVLVHGGAGGVGHIVVQLAKASGAEVFATGSSGRRDDIERSGASFIDRSEAVDDYVRRCTGSQGFELIYDTVGGGALDASFQAVRRFGHVVSALGWGTHALAPLSFKSATYSGVFTLLPLLTGEGRAHHGFILREAAKLVEAGLVTPQVDHRRFTLETVSDAYRALQDGSARGKLVVDIAASD